MNFKKIGTYLLYLLPWFISSILFRSDTSYYNSLNKPFFAPASLIFGIVWPILYILICYSIYKIYNISNNNYKKALIINYISNQLFTFFFFTIKNNFLSLIDTIIILISSIYLYQSTKIIEKKYSKFLIPYIIWNIYAFILIASIFVMN